MLTVNDKTIADPAHLVTELSYYPQQAIGIKEAGVAPEDLYALLSQLRSTGRDIYLEVMSDDVDDCLHCINAAAKAKIKAILGTRRTQEIDAAIRIANIDYYPVIDEFTAYARTIEGDSSNISELSRHIAEGNHITGTLLNPYRIACNPQLLIRSVHNSTKKPVFITGSINSIKRLKQIHNEKVHSIGIGSAILEKSLVAGNIKDQLQAIYQVISQKRGTR